MLELADLDVNVKRCFLEVMLEIVEIRGRAILQTALLLNCWQSYTDFRCSSCTLSEHSVESYLLRCLMKLMCQVLHVFWNRL